MAGSRIKKFKMIKNWSEISWLLFDSFCGLYFGITYAVRDLFRRSRKRFWRNPRLDHSDTEQL